MRQVEYMEREHKPVVTPLTGIHIDLEERTIEFENRYGTVARLLFRGETVLFEGIPVLVAGLRGRSPGDADDESVTPEVASPAGIHAAAGAEVETEVATITVSGTLLTQPRPGRVDKNQKPTAWAKLAVPTTTGGEPEVYLATFHNHTRAAALTLGAGSALTVEGYLHPPHRPKRLATFSVMALTVSGSTGER